MAFSGALTLTDLNDFITPSQACIKPVEQVLPPPEKESGAASTEIQIDSSGVYHELEVGSSKTKKLQKAEISLNDCLACSGCITSAESVLITMQSHLEVLSFLDSNPPPDSPDHAIPVISISPQSLASLSAATPSNPPLRRILRRVQAFCTQDLGFHRAYDTTFARHVALEEHLREFMERRETHASASGKEKEKETMRLPMLSSACPGWVCYAEKTHAEMIPFMSRTKSPQQVMGTLVKEWLGRKWGKSPDKVYHVTVMPCYDKKLEASRKDFYSDVYSTRDVDCVITTGELETMMREKGWDLTRPVPFEDLPASPSASEIPELIQHSGTSSGSYLHSIIASLQAQHPSTILSSKVIRNSDYEEFVLKDTNTNAVIFKGAKCYGFRNLQNVVRKVGRDAGVQTAKGAAAGKGAASVALNRRRLKQQQQQQDGAGGEDARGYDYVEVMACPSGCVNGGGQLRPPPPPPPSSTLPTTTAATDFAPYWKAAEDTAPLGTLTPVSSSAASTSTSASDPISAKWGDKAWTSKVEAAYWVVADDDALPTPPSSPGRAPSPAEIISTATASEISRLADERSATVVAELLEGAGGRGRREALLRTEFRAVETNDVVGLTVQW